ncbi:MAG: prepilin-type N-terminal cleavage/methylation domain-containing protein [Erysipelotrichaceae bacterium]
MKKLNKKGFTLIELIVVIAILAILAMILIPSLTGYIAKATNAKNAANCRSLYTQYQLDLAVATGTVAIDVPADMGGVHITVPAAAQLPGTSLAAFACTGDGYTFSYPSFVGVKTAP